MLVKVPPPRSSEMRAGGRGSVPRLDFGQHALSRDEYEGRIRPLPSTSGATSPRPTPTTPAPSSRHVVLRPRPDAKFSQTPHRIQFGNHRDPDRQRQGEAQILAAMAFLFSPFPTINQRLSGLLETRNLQFLNRSKTLKIAKPTNNRYTTGRMGNALPAM